MSTHLFNVPIDHVSYNQLDTILRSWVRGHAQRMIVTPNPEILLRARHDKEFLSHLQSAHLSLPDGVGLRYATAALTDRNLRFRHTGVDTVNHLAKICEDYGKTIVLFGGQGDVSKRSATRLRQSYRDLDIIGMNPGEIKSGEGGLEVDEDILRELQQLEPTVLAVALGAGKQEQFIRQYLKELPSVKVAIGVGGAVDMISGELSRAPAWMRTSGLEWAWRLVQEPSRFGRIWQASVVFPSVVAYDSLRQRRLGRATFRVLPEVLRQLSGK
jgi:N-acetylglucosaminyldiphosphoundecaprenol N-acetyl-beta-D-mannosaminyltransferase